ncbi:hypothetical protein [Pinirhizobacter soli]|uniref:hypothetical protein n=1 Tax=Pinirhizobacter soli TaxID=2786953 RepID=UPI00202AB128|nr:hypothetical protein [Pinirhizobacter soli]
MREVGPGFDLRGELAEVLRPWKLFVFCLGMGWLLWGALTYHFPDWDVGISCLMGALAYAFAPWTVRLIASAVRWRDPGWQHRILLGLVVSWTVVDGSYVIYNTLRDHEMLRADNAIVSGALFFGLGVILSFRGSLKQLFRQCRFLTDSSAKR